LLPPPIEKLPDASLLLNSPILSEPVGTDHCSRVAAALAENASRKREANGSSSSNIRGKIPRGNLTHSKNIPDTGSGQLVPPQLLGRCVFGLEFLWFITFKLKNFLAYIMYFLFVIESSE